MELHWNRDFHTCHSKAKLLYRISRSIHCDRRTARQFMFKATIIALYIDCDCWCHHYCYITKIPTKTKTKWQTTVKNMQRDTISLSVKRLAKELLKFILCEFSIWIDRWRFRSVKLVGLKSVWFVIVTFSLLSTTLRG